MAITRRGFLHRTGVAAAAGLVAGCRPGSRGVSDTVLSAAGVRCTSSHTFTNWSHTLRFQPERFCRPSTEEQVVAIVKDALKAGTHVRTQGAGHSFSPLLPTTDTLLTLDDLKSPIRVEGNRVTVPGGMRLKHLIPELKKRGLALRNMGSVTEQSIAGAFSTGTHGSGLRLGAMSTQVVGVRLVDGSGEVRTITEGDAADLAAARINLGALGIITEVTLDCVPHHQLEYTAYAARFDEVLERLDALNQANDRVVVWWPVLKDGLLRDKVVLITKNAVGRGSPAAEAADRSAPVVPRQRLPMDSEDLGKVAAPSPVDGLLKVRQFVGDYDEVLTIPLLPVFHRECEYAIPVERTREALQAFRRVVEEGDLHLDLPVEVRFVASDDILLSPAHGRDVCYIGASTLFNSTEVFERFERIMKSLDGRSHWGKNFTKTRAEVAEMWPATYEPFRTILQKYDPAGVFANSMLDELFPREDLPRL